MARRAEDLPPTVVVIEDEFSTMADDEYRKALDRWLAELDAAEPIDIEVSAADALRSIREDARYVGLPVDIEASLLR